MYKNKRLIKHIFIDYYIWTMGCCIITPYIYSDGGIYDGKLKNGLPVCHPI